MYDRFNGKKPPAGRTFSVFTAVLVLLLLFPATVALAEGLTIKLELPPACDNPGVGIIVPTEEGLACR